MASCFPFRSCMTGIANISYFQGSEKYRLVNFPQKSNKVLNNVENLKLYLYKLYLFCWINFIFVLLKKIICFTEYLLYGILEPVRLVTMLLVYYFVSLFRVHPFDSKG